MAGTRIGVVGASSWASVDDAGTVALPDGRRIGWLVGAEDRWHDPAEEPSRRQRLVDDVAVVETAIRVPGGDAVVRAYGIAAAGVPDGLVALEVENASPSPFALALVARAGGGVPALSTRAPSGVAVEGIALPPGSPTWPVAHRSTLRIVLPVTSGTEATWPAAVPPSTQVARGWLAQSERLLRAELGDEGRMARLRAARAGVLLAADDPVARLLAGDVDVDEVAATTFALARPRRGRRGAPVEPAPAAAPWALAVAARLLDGWGEDRAAADARAVLGRLGPTAAAGDGPVDVLAGLRDRLVGDLPDAVALLPDGDLAPPGVGIEVHDVDTRHGRVGFAVRWHGRRPALLWDLERPVRVTCPGLDPAWSDHRATGEALLAEPLRGVSFG